MKNKRFKMLFAVGVILSIFSFTACGSTGEENKSNSESEQMQETEEEKKRKRRVSLMLPILLKLL